MSSIPIGVQLYSVRHDLARDPLATLKAVAAMGYTGVEFFGEPQRSAQELREMLDEARIACCGWHVPYALLQDDKLEETVAFHRTLGNDKLICPGVPEELRRTHADWLRLAAFFDGVAAKLAPHGMVTGYHNHHIEFTPLEGEQPWDTLFGHTGRGVVMQFDTGNGLYGGADVLGIIRKYPGRAVTVHIKPYAPSAAEGDPEAGFRPLIGDDDIDWLAFFAACETVGGTQWYIVEYESDLYPPLEAVDRCLQALRKMGK